MPASPIRWDGSAMSQQGDEYRRLSFWHDTVPGSLEPAPSLDGDTEADVAIAGAGLNRDVDRVLPERDEPWAADRALRARDRRLRRRPAATVAGARALFPASLPKLERMAGPGVGHRDVPRDAADGRRGRQGSRQTRASTVTWAKGGTVQFARSDAQMEAGQPRGA